MKFKSFLFLFFIILSPLLGTSVTWDGNNGSNPSDVNWTSATNWVSTNPTTNGGFDIYFDGSNKLNNVADNNNWTINSLNFLTNASSFNISGQQLKIGSGGITNNSSNTQTISNQISVTNDQSWTAIGNVVVSGYISSSNKNLNLNGSGNITLSNQIDNLNTITLNGSGNRNIGIVSQTNMVVINNTGNNTFSGQVNVKKLEINAGNNVFSSTINAQNQGITISNTGNATFNGEVNSGNNGITFNGSGNVVFNERINNAGTLSITGGGTLTLSGNGQNNISNTLVQNGNLILDQTGGNSINGPITIGSEGTVLFEGNNQIPSWQTVTLLEGSTMYINDTQQSFANLIVEGSSIIDFGTGGSTLNVQNITINNDSILTIQNWNSMVDQFISVNNPNNSVVKIYYADTGQTATWTTSGGFIRPGNPVPEPSTYGFFLIGFVLFISIFRRSYYMNKRLT